MLGTNTWKIMLLGGISLGAIGQGAERDGLRGFANAEKVTAKLSSGNTQQTISGKSSIMLKASEKDYEQGRVQVKQLNLVFKDVEQKLLSGRKPREMPKGNLSFSINSAKAQYLKLDRSKTKITGQLSGKLAYSQMAELFPIRESAKQDSFSTPLQDGLVQIDIELEKPMDPDGESLSKIIETALSINLNVRGIKKRLFQPFQIFIGPVKWKFEWTWFWQFQAIKKLCVQPVRFVAGFADSDPTGDGWAFGLPGLRKEWKKAAVLFQTRPFITINDASLKVVTNSETTSVRNTVNAWDCVEVYFAERFSPQAMFGGGATWFGGTADTKIISTDENADFNVDFTHLAHEMGHAIDLHHPGSGFPATSSALQDSSTGTLMCPSGFNNDNPDVNSEDNADRVNNPLFTFAWRLVSNPAQPDCASSSDCGACP